MKESWISDSEEVLVELISLIDNKVPLSIYYKKDFPPFSVVLQHVFGCEGCDYLILEKPAGFEKRDEYCALYKKKGEPSKGFLLTIKNISGKQLAAAIPEEIFRINLRRHARIDTPDTSTATFLLENSGGDINTCRVKDVSLQGACLSGRPVSTINVGDELGSVTLTLTMEDYKTETRDIVVPTAKVVRTARDDAGEKIAGISFHPDDDMREQLSKYMDIRVWESGELAE